MDVARAFHGLLLKRLLQAVVLAVPAATAAATGCGSSVGGNTSAGTGGSGGGAGGHGGSPSQMSTQCIPWPPQGGTASGSSGGTGDAGTDGGGGQSASSTGSSGPPMCPSRAEALADLASCNVTKVLSDAMQNSGSCCYQTLGGTCGNGSGRPFMVEGQGRAAAPRPGRAWSANAMILPRLDDLSLAVRARLAEAWTRDGLLEHASVASFGRFALELLAVGAPPELVELAHLAALDEVRHARLCLGLAGAYAGAAVTPAPFPFGGSVEISSDLASIAARAAREGCIGETIAAAQAAEQHAGATDPAVRAVLAGIVEDETRHAELAFRTVAWAVRQGGAPVRAAVAAVLAEIEHAEVAAVPREPWAEILAAHGRLDAATQRALAARALDEVVRPCVRALLGPAEDAPS